MIVVWQKLPRAAAPVAAVRAVGEMQGWGMADPMRKGAELRLPRARAFEQKDYQINS